MPHKKDDYLNINSAGSEHTESQSQPLAMSAVAEPHGNVVLGHTEVDLVKKHHGDIVYEPHGFFAKIHRKDAELNRTIVNNYTTLHEFQDKEERVSKRRENATSMTNAFYDLVTDFYEYGWGESFHFARTYKGDTFEQSIKRHEQFLTLKLGLGPDTSALDVGCGVGGPLREIVRLCGAHVTGLNNNAYQIERCKHYSRKLGLETKTSFVKGDFTSMPRELYGRFDKAYALEATVHSPKLETVYAEVFRALKPGGMFATYEWCTTDMYDPDNPEHVQIIQGIEKGNSIPSLSSSRQVLEAAYKVGFEILEDEDMAILQDGHDPWYNTLLGNFSLSGFRMTRLGRWTTHALVSALEFARIAAPGSTDVSSFLMLAADALVAGGVTGIFTPMYFVLMRKPLDA